MPENALVSPATQFGLPQADQLPIGLVLADPQAPAFWHYVNPEFARLVGCPPDELVGQPAAVQRLNFIRGTTNAYDLAFTNRQGRLVYCKLKTAYHAWQGQTYWLGYYTDVSQKVRAIYNLAECERVLRETQAAAKIGSISLDFGTGRFEWTEEAFRIFGILPNSKTPSAKVFFDSIHPDDRPGVLAQIEVAIQRETPLHLHYRIVLPNQQVRYLELAARPAAQPRRFVGTVHQVDSPAAPLSDQQLEIKRLESLVHQATEAMVVLDPLTAQVIFWSHGAEQLYGRSTEEALGQRWDQLLPGTYHPSPSFEAFFAELMETGYWQGELRQTNHDNRPLVVDVTFRVVPAPTGHAPEVLVFCTNKTPYASAEEEASKLERTLQLISDNIPGWMFFVDKNLTVIGCNRIFAETLGGQISDFIDKPVQGLPLSGEFLTHFEAQARKITQANAGLLQYSAQAHSQGRTYWLDLKVAPMRDRTGQLMGVLATADDVTEERRMAEQLREQEREQERVRSLAIVKGQEEERERVARELHDGVGQMLSAVQMKLRYLANHTDAPGQQLQTDFEQAEKLAQDANQEIRRISRNLMPSVLSDFGLAEALENLAHTTETSTGIDVDFFGDLGGRRFSPETEVAVYRIAQEAINNVQKYSQAKHLMIELSASAGQLQLIIEDNGQGFDLEKIRRGNGLSNLQHRARLLNGQVIIRTAPGQGTRITTLLPVPELEAPPAPVG
ncbi:MAG: PAS domain S-box protein [Bernardetiaceae bacterium]|jgi:PAS domain S-box-containing protein|nr:PAS domain S-box protein [Bernardetiaceae bacterium]